jgi:hypothetical protein
LRQVWRNLHASSWPAVLGTNDLHVIHRVWLTQSRKRRGSV